MTVRRPAPAPTSAAEPSGRPSSARDVYLLDLEELRHPGSRISLLHGPPEQVSAPLTADEHRLWRKLLLLGTVGSVLMGFAALGAGAQPVRNILLGAPILGIIPRLSTVGIPLAILGLAMLVLAWLRLRTLCDGVAQDDGTARRLSRHQLYRTLGAWSLPLVLAPPMYSRDAYSYLAIGMVAAYGDDPYARGPYDALGPGHPLAENIPLEWRHTPAQYGPAFILLARGIAYITRDCVEGGILLHRLLALIGIGLSAWALPHLARRCGVAAVNALWLSLLNPLVIIHFVAGVHNESLMLGVMVVGLELALRGLADRPFPDRRTVALVTLGAALIAISAAMKISTLLALGFVGVAVARRLRGNDPRSGTDLIHLAVSAVWLGLVTAVTWVVLTVAAGLTFAWAVSSGAATTIISWTAPATFLGMLTNFASELLGLGDRELTYVTIVRILAALLAVLLAGRFMYAVWRGTVHPVGGFGVAMFFTVLLFPVVHGWYLLWALLPLSAWANTSRFRVPAVLASVVFCFVVFPPGGWIQPDIALTLSLVGAASTLVMIIVVHTRYTPLFPPRSPRTPPTERTDIVSIP